MKSVPKPLLTALLVSVVLAGGILFAVRSCVFGKGGAPPGMREQFAAAPALVIEKDGKAVVLTIVSHLKIHSYSRRGNMVQKSASTTYYLQSNDAVTASMLKEVKLKGHTEIRNYPVEVIGSAGGIAWIFAGEPMAFDVSTLEKRADLKILEEKNKALAGRFPAERRFYRFDNRLGRISITASDGTQWILDGQTLMATAAGDNDGTSGAEADLAAVEAAEKKNQADMDSLYQQKDRRPSNDYAAGKISAAEYNRISREYREERKKLMDQRDSLRREKYRYRDQQRDEENLERSLENLAEGNVNYSNLRVNQDSMGSQWFGLYAPAEFRSLSDRFQSHTAYEETARRQLYISEMESGRNGERLINKAAATVPPGQSGFLQGGFLLDKNTARPARLNGNSYLLVHKDKIGREAMILVSRINTQGKTLWTFSTGLTDWADWSITGKSLVLLGTDNKELSANQVNLLLCIDLEKGTGNRYDYYQDKVRTDR